MNKAATQITGLSKEEVNNRYLSDVFPGITTCGLFDLLLKVWRTGTADHLPVTLYEDEHLSLWVENYVYKLPTGQIVVVFDDVTKRIEMEKKSEEQQQKLVQADKLASIGTLATGVAHEINNPNQSILSNTSFLKHAWDEIIPILDEYYEENGDFLIRGLEYSVIRDEMEGYHSIIEECSKRINTIVQDLKEFARYDPDWEMEAVDMNVILHAAITLTTNFIKKSTNNFELAYGDNLPKVWGNAQKLEQVIINIIQNGCQALPDKGKRLRVRTYIDSTDHTVVTEVTDEGTGISEKHLSKIKDPFFTTKRTRGTGLGLSVSHSIIEEHGGELVFDSEEGKGTKVQLRLPAYHPSSR
jgi:polar amino acid transport system substrate-binding protein